MFNIGNLFKKKKQEQKQENVSFEPASLDFEDIKKMIEEPKFDISKQEPLPFEQPQTQELPLFKPEVPYSKPFGGVEQPVQPPTQPIQLPKQEPKPEPKIEKETFVERKEKPEFFIKIEKYEEVLAILNSMTLKVKELENVLSKLEEIKKEEEQRLEEWKKRIEEVREKINKVIEDLKGE